MTSQIPGIQPLYKVGADRKSSDSFDRQKSLAGSMSKGIEEPETTIGEGAMTGLGGAAAGVSVASAMGYGATAGTAGGPPGMLIGAGIGGAIGLLAAFG